ncbi:related to ZZ type zinc finger domain protein [Rhynchosporium graminicola]|uniref:Related to ZZ type zinc finger domain protein n=1 Tax=Rhynchosporium graminicola TaxID=2792576 RepID=A0A1E1JQ31_9HELO|nr:related to ZZ type zinc finger domain protein [Rhynchosporium commune]
MASTSTHPTPATTPDTLVTLKINIEGTNRRFKLPLRDLVPSTLPEKLRFLLSIPPSSESIFERYSDSAAAFIVLDSNNPSVYKQLYRAAKAKLKLRLKVTIKEKEPVTPKPATVEDEEPSPVSPVDEKPAPVEPTPEAAPAPVAVSTASNSEKTMYPGTVAEIQRGFEELLINHNQRSTPTFTPYTQPSSSSTCCSQLNRNIPAMFLHPDDIARMNPCSGTEIPVTRGSAARDKWFAELAGLSSLVKPAAAQVPIVPASPTPETISVFSVYCNNCQVTTSDAHYHCSTCDEGDFDLCQGCVDQGVTCDGDDHWMIKRFVKNGQVINSTTETIAPRASSGQEKSESVDLEEDSLATRTCNSCISELSEENFVTCTSCPDYDLCIPCHVSLDHGHHPEHAFEPAVEDTTLDMVADALLAPGRNVGHNAICDGCDKYIYGVRHKCLDCPDWDYCSACHPNASFVHPGHRFVPLFEPINDLSAMSRAFALRARHYGIYCDGPLCNSGSPHSFIQGDRYKCAVCHDTDFCANCEASPSNRHNRTHPLIKFKTPVRNVSVTTLGDHEDGQRMPTMGDRRGRSSTSKATETTPARSSNAATQVQTVADLKPTEPVKVEPEVKKGEAKELPAAAKEDLVAHFVRDVIADGTIMLPNSVFEQTWYLRNGGNTSWPAGCTVKFVGGDNMCAVDPEHPASVHELVSAAESTTCYTAVAPGQEAGFTVLMRTPSRAGNSISYWRLTGPDGEKFGHRLWCDVNVVVPEPVIKQELKVEAEGSQMIFPKLEKESPASSIHRSPPAAPVVNDEVDDFEDFVDEPIEDNETDDGFMTDEEYDILDASDEEMIAEQSKLLKK